MRLSIIIPAYNCANTIERTLNSLLFSIEYEIIVIDDGSTDNTYEVVKKQMEIDSRIRYVYQSNQGVSAARNYGFKLAQGDYIYFIDSDDYLTNVKELNLVLSSDITEDLIIFGYYLVNENKSKSEVRFKNEIVYSIPTDYEDFISHCFIKKEYRGAVWNKIYSRNIIIQNRLFFSSYKDVWSEDSLFNIEYMLSETPIKILQLNQSFVVHDYHEGSLSNSRTQENIQNRIVSSIKTINKVLRKKENKIFEALSVYYNVNYLLKYSIASITINGDPFRTYKRSFSEVLKTIYPDILDKKVDNEHFTMLFSSGNQSKYYRFLFNLLKNKRFNLLSIFLWLRYKILY